MSKSAPKETVVFRGTMNSAVLRDIAWRVQGLAHLLSHSEVDAVWSKQQAYGVGQILQDLGDELEIMSNQLEGVPEVEDE